MGLGLFKRNSDGSFDGSFLNNPNESKYSFSTNWGKTELAHTGANIEGAKGLSQEQLLQQFGDNRIGRKIAASYNQEIGTFDTSNLGKRSMRRLSNGLPASPIGVQLPNPTLPSLPQINSTLNTSQINELSTKLEENNRLRQENANTLDSRVATALSVTGNANRAKALGMSLEDYLNSDVRAAINQKFSRTRDTSNNGTQNLETQSKLGNTNKIQIEETQPEVSISSQPSNAWDGFTFDQYGTNWWEPRKSTTEGTNWYLDAAGNDFDLYDKTKAPTLDNRNYKGGIVRQMYRDSGVNRLEEAKKQFTEWYRGKNPLAYKTYYEGGSYGDQLKAYNKALNDAYEGWLKQTTGKNSWEQFKNGGKLISKKIINKYGNSNWK